MSQHQESRPGPGHLLHYLPDNVGTVLDVGCNTGEMTSHAVRLGAKKGIGVDVNATAIEHAKKKFSSDNRLEFRVSPSQQLSLESSSVDAVILSEVLEHVPVEFRAGTIAEIGRVLKPGGRLLMSVPFSSLTEILDPENMRFRLPKVYGLVSRILGGKDRDVGFENTNFKVEWHHHFKMTEIETLFANHLSIEDLRFRGAFIFPLAEWFVFPFNRKGWTDNPLYRALRFVQTADTAYQAPRSIAYDVIVLGKKAG